MEKPILLISAPIEKKDLSTIKELAKEYHVVEAKDFNGSVDLVEIMYGWNKSLGQKIIDSTTNQLKWIQADSAGVDHLDLVRLNELGVLLTNASGVHGNQMSESILGMIFAYTRNIKKAILNQEKSKWEKEVEATDLEGKQIMIVGTGHIGERLAEILSVFHAIVVGVNRSGHPVPHFDKTISLENIHDELSEMDIVVNLLPDTKATHYFFSENLFKQMKKGVIFINAGRGGTVNTEELISYCQNGTIGFAGLDVFETEPLPQESPLWKLPNVLVTSHISGVTDKYYTRLMPIFLTNLKAFLLSSDVVQNKVDLTSNE